MRCDVCGQVLISRYWELPDGRRWCARHRDAATCAHCGIPLGVAQVGDSCGCCSDSPVLTVTDMQPHKLALSDHMRAIGLTVATPTQILLARPGQVFERHQGSQQHGDTRWTVAHGEVQAPIRIRLAGGLPAHVFRRTLAHEYGHAATAGGPAMGVLPLPYLEGFAECVAVAHLAAIRSPHSALQIKQIEQCTDPVYGGGFRLVRPAVALHGLVAVAEAIRLGEPHRVGLGASGQNKRPSLTRGWLKKESA